MNTATDKQIGFIYSLNGQIGEELAARVAFDTLSNFLGYDFLTKREASKLIDALIDARDNGYDTEDEFGFDYSTAELESMFALLDC